MLAVTDSIRDVLVPLLVVIGALQLVLVCYIVVLHGVSEIAFRRRQRLLRLYRPITERTLIGDAAERSIAELVAAPRRHRAVLAVLLLDPLRVTGGLVADRGRAAATALGLVEQWTLDLEDRRWWRRAEAARALGLVRCRAVVTDLATALDDEYDEVRAAAVEALGAIADPVAIPELIARLADQSRHQRVRLVQALQQFGAAAVSPLLAHGQANPRQRISVAEVLGSIGAAGSIDALIEWSADERAEARAAIWRAVGTIGVDDRAYYHILRALNDESELVRATAAWALGRSGRHDAARYLAGRLNDDWIVAVHTARALRALGPAGRRELEQAASNEGSELARQMLWECTSTATG